MEGMTLEKLQVIIEAQTKAYYDELKKVQAQTKSATSAVEKQTDKIKSAFSKIGKAVGIALSVTAIISFGKSCIQLGSALSEVQNVVDVTFGAMSETVNEFARNAIEQFGLSETSAKQYTSTMGAMLKSMGFTTQAAADMSMNMTGLAADMASFYNLDSSEAFAKIRAGISGETEPLKQLGINMSVANLEAYALSQGINKAYNSMSQQEQALLRYNYLLSATGDAQGDFARTSDSWANQVRILTERFNALKATIGQGLIAVLTPVIRVLNTLLGKIQTVADAFSNLIAKLTGKKAAASSGSSAIASSVDTATDSVDSLGSATDAAGTSAKKAEEAYSGLGSFDEIHSLTKNEDSSGGSGGGGGGGGAGSVGDAATDAAEAVDGEVNPVLDKLITKLKELQQLFQNGFKAGLGNVDLSGITKAVDGIKKSLKDIFTDSEVLGAANNYINTLAYSLGQQAGAVASVGITIATNILGGIDKYLSENTGRIKQFIVDMFNISAETEAIKGNFAQAAANIFSVFGGENGQQVTANIIGIFADAAMGMTTLAAKLGRDVLNMLTKPFIDNQEGFKTAIDGTLGVAAQSLGVIKGVVDNTFKAMNKVYDEHIKPMFDAFATGLSSITSTLLEAYNTYILPVIQGLIDKVGPLVDEHIQPMINKAVELIGKIADAISDIWNQTLVPFINWFIKNVAPYIAAGLNVVGSVFITVWGVVADVVSSILGALGGLVDFIAGVFTGDWDRAWEGIKTFFSGIWEAIKTIMSTVWGAIKSIVSAAIGVVSSVISTVLNTIKTVFSTIFNAIKTTVSTIITTIKTSISTTLTSISTNWSTMWNGMKTAVTNIFNGIWGAIKGVINSIIGGIESMANAVIKGINSMIKALNNLSFDVPDWVPEIGGKTFGFNISTLGTISIPRLAMGGVVDQATLAMVGENGQEAVVPLENNTGWMDKIASRIGEIVAINMRAIVAQGDGDQTITTIVKLDSKTLVEQTDKYRRRKGYELAPI